MDFIKNNLEIKIIMIIMEINMRTTMMITAIVIITITIPTIIDRSDIITSISLFINILYN